MKDNIRHEVYELLDKLIIGMTFHGSDLKREVCRNHPEWAAVYEETFLRAMRHYNQETNKKVGIICVAGEKSHYMVISAEEYDQKYSKPKQILVSEEVFKELKTKAEKYDKESLKFLKRRVQKATQGELFD